MAITTFSTGTARQKVVAGLSAGLISSLIGNRADSSLSRILPDTTSRSVKAKLAANKARVRGLAATALVSIIRRA